MKKTRALLVEDDPLVKTTRNQINIPGFFSPQFVMVSYPMGRDARTWGTPRDIPQLFFSPSPEAGLVAASDLARYLEGLLTVPAC